MLLCGNREVLEIYPNLRPNLLAKLLETMPTIKSPRVYRSVLWIIGEYAYASSEIASSFATIKQSLGDVPFAELSGTAPASSTPSTPREVRPWEFATACHLAINMLGCFARGGCWLTRRVLWFP